MRHNNIEHKHQEALHKFCRINGLLSFAIENGGTRHKGEGINLKKRGVTSGVSDYCVILKDLVLFIEMKRPRDILKNGKTSTVKIITSINQKSFIKKVNQSDVCVAKVCYGFDEAKEFINFMSNL